MSISIQNVIDMMTTPAIPCENTVDNMLFGNPSKPLTGVAVTFLATQETIQKAIDLGANLIISHEGIFFSHNGGNTILESDPVYIKKCKSIEESGISIFRYHDYIHRFQPDAVTAGLVQALGWENYLVEKLTTSSILEIPSVTVKEVLDHIKNCLGIDYVRYEGDLSMLCNRIGLLVGYRGGRDQVLPLFHDKNLDMVIYGEGPEWETPEYVRDAIYQGKNKSLIVLGHSESEMPAMKYLTQLLQAKFPEIPFHFIPQAPVFKIY